MLYLHPILSIATIAIAFYVAIVGWKLRLRPALASDRAQSMLVEGNCYWGSYRIRGAVRF